ncbi:MAG: zf-HC2 domain-containing protein [Lachnospiraceae bacterium]|nr:zf-HC2 domain-containing protein [Lachnospiraceae bacterium]
MMMECGKIRDMMHLYVDELCSEESRKWVEGHIASCPECKAKLEELKKERERENEFQNKVNKDKGQIDEKSVKKELKPFRKLRRKLWMCCVFDVVVILIALIIIPMVCNWGFMGWKKIEYHHVKNQAKKTTQFLLDGDSEHFLKEIEPSEKEMCYIKETTQWEKVCIKRLDDFYEKELKNKHPLISKVYIDELTDLHDTILNKLIDPSSEEQHYETLIVAVKTDEKKFEFRYNPNRFDLNNYGIEEVHDGEQDTDQTCLSLQPFNDLYYFTKNTLNYFPFMWVKLMAEELNQKYAENKGKVPFILKGLDHSGKNLEYQTMLWEELKSVFDLSMSLEETSCTDVKFNEDAESFESVLIWKFKNKDGKLIYLRKRVAIPSFKPLEQETEIVGEDISDEEMNALKNLFVEK